MCICVRVCFLSKRNLCGLAYLSGRREQVACCFTRGEINLTGVSSSRRHSSQKQTSAGWPDSCGIRWLKTPNNHTIIHTHTHTLTYGLGTAANNTQFFGCRRMVQILLMDAVLFLISFKSESVVLKILGISPPPLHMLVTCN